MSHVTPMRDSLNVFGAADVYVSIGNTLCNSITDQTDVIRGVSTDPKATQSFETDYNQFFCPDKVAARGRLIIYLRPVVGARADCLTAFRGNF